MIEVQFQIFCDPDPVGEITWICYMPAIPRIGDELAIPEDELPDDIGELYARVTDVLWHLDSPSVHICAAAVQPISRRFDHT